MADFGTAPGSSVTPGVSAYDRCARPRLHNVGRRGIPPRWVAPPEAGQPLGGRKPGMIPQDDETPDHVTAHGSGVSRVCVAVRAAQGCFRPVGVWSEVVGSEEQAGTMVKPD